MHLPDIFFITCVLVLYMSACLCIYKELLDKLTDNKELINDIKFRIKQLEQEKEN